ncbi:hypothetical protein LOK49_LG01G03134 [Camellia lanceoleosa]|uniref:Uncharacterized protein n=1 Tax=Camellia lanceoleosa TaxID=1840588 RepID=A0ACC0J2I4_9ERIC|nr:hypothetical protein LOK49_LG01G03134 [Camellia lanceoleosa]
MSDKFITVQMPHEGHVVFHPHIVYEGGRVNEIINCDIEKMSMFELRDHYYDLISGKGANIDMYYTWPSYSLDVGLKTIYSDVDVMKMLEAYRGLDYVVVYVEKGVDPIMVLSSNGELLLDPNGAKQGGNAIGGGDTEQGGNAICGGDIDIIDINLSGIDIIVDDIGNDSDDSQIRREGSMKSSQNQARKS